MRGYLMSGVAGLVLVAGGWWLSRDPGGSEAMPAAMESTGMRGVAEGEAIVTPRLPESLSDMGQIGARAFAAKCVACHGENAAGVKGSGPPLVHKIYEPGHHADFAFQMAVQNGVRAHHWPFGDMAPVEGLSGADVKAITAYVRELQRANGIGVN